MDEDKVSNKHKCYDGQQGKRDVYAAIRTTDTIRDGGTSYLPKYPAEESGEYDSRKKASTIDGIVSSGVDVLTGAVFYEEINTEGVNASIVPFLENIDNKGNHFNVFARDAFKASFDGFSAIIVDVPAVSADIRSLEDQQKLGLRPYWRLYKAKDVINWRYVTDPMSKQIILSMIVFKECSHEPDGRFKEKEVVRYRHWFLDEMGNARWELYVELEKDKPVIEAAGPLGQLKALPVALVGDVMDDPKLLGESRLEIKAYQKESSFDVIEYLSIPTFYTKGYPADGPKLALGASTHIQLPADPAAEAGYIQIDAAGHESLKGSIKDIKDKIGARVNEMVESADQGEAMTATESVINDTDKQARLIVWADELHDALETALMYTGQLMGLGEDKGGTIELGTKWAAKKAQAEEAKQMKAETDMANVAMMKAKATPA